MTATIENFDDLVRMALAETDPPQLLTVLVKAESVHQQDEDGQERPLAGEGVLKPIMVKSCSVTPELAFEQLKAEATELDDRWAFMMLAILPGRHAKPPAPGDVDEHLKNMARTLLTGGDLGRYLFVDRHGELVRISAAIDAGSR
jgi:hypothetical protein